MKPNMVSISKDTRLTLLAAQDWADHPHLTDRWLLPATARTSTVIIESIPGWDDVTKWD